MYLYFCEANHLLEILMDRRHQSTFTNNLVLTFMDLFLLVQIGTLFTISMVN